MDEPRLSLADDLRHRILEEIRSQRLLPGAKLDSERVMAARYSVSRASLRLALTALEREGRVTRTHGRSGGTFVARPKIRRNPTTATPVPDYLSLQGYNAGTRIIRTELTVCDDAIADALQLSPGAAVCHINRIVFADDEPFSVEYSWLPAERFVGLLERPLGGSIYRLLSEEYGVEPNDVEEYIEIARASDEEAALLRVPEQEPLLAVRRIAREQSGKPFEYSIDLFRGDRIAIHVSKDGVLGRFSQSR